MIVAIAAAEIAFWVLLLGGLLARYVARWARVSSLLLLAVPLVDVALVALVAVDVAGGAPPSRAHALAAVYLGVTVAFGHRTVAWADARFRHRFAGGPKPTKPAKGSRAEVRALWGEWFRVVLAATIAAALLALLIAVEGAEVPRSAEAVADQPYWSMLALLAIVTGGWFLAGPAFAGTGRDAGRDAGRDRGVPGA